MLSLSEAAKAAGVSKSTILDAYHPPALILGISRLTLLSSTECFRSTQPAYLWLGRGLRAFQAARRFSTFRTGSGGPSAGIDQLGELLGLSVLDDARLSPYLAARNS